MIRNSSTNLPRYNKDNRKLKVAIVKSLYHENLTHSLEKSCRQYLVESGIKNNNITTFEVPGSWEIPLIVKKIAESKKFDGIIALGVIIKGKTYHFEVLANECAKALMNIALEFNIPITFEILATYNLEQAKKRSIGEYNKGKEAALVLLETIKTLSKL